MLAPPLNQHFGFLQRVKDLHVEGFVSVLRVEAGDFYKLRFLMEGAQDGMVCSTDLTIGLGDFSDLSVVI